MRSRDGVTSVVDTPDGLRVFGPQVWVSSGVHLDGAGLVDGLLL